MDSEFHTDNRPVVITGFPYAYPYYARVFDFFERKDTLIFLLPKFWSAKKGKVKIHLEPKEGIPTYGMHAVSYGGKSLLGGIFKGWMPGMIWRLPHVRFKFKSKVLYSCSEPNLLTTLYYGIIAKVLGMKHVIFTWQNVPPEERLRGMKLRLSNMLVKLNLAFSDGIICGNQKAEHIVRNFQPSGAKLKTLVAPLAGVDMEKFKPDSTVSKSDPPLILFAGALEKRKGISFLIEAYKTIDIPCKLLIVGTGPERKAWEEQSRGLDVEFRDWVRNEELPRLLCSATVFVYPSIPQGGWEEQFGYAMAEASACEVPVVASDSGSIQEVVSDSVTGLLVPPQDPSVLARALSMLIGNPLVSSTYGKAGRVYVADRFSHAAVAKKIENFLIQIA